MELRIGENDAEYWEEFNKRHKREVRKILYQGIALIIAGGLMNMAIMAMFFYPILRGLGIF